MKTRLNHFYVLRFYDHYDQFLTVRFSSKGPQQSKDSTLPLQISFAFKGLHTQLFDVAVILLPQFSTKLF